MQGDDGGRIAGGAAFDPGEERAGLDVVAEVREQLDDPAGNATADGGEGAMAGLDATEGEDGLLEDAFFGPSIFEPEVGDGVFVEQDGGGGGRAGAAVDGERKGG